MKLNRFSSLHVALAESALGQWPIVNTSDWCLPKIEILAFLGIAT